MKWVTRANVKVDRVACPWLIRTFIDQDAEFLFVPVSEVESVARKTGAIPYDVAGVELGNVRSTRSSRSTTSTTKRSAAWR